MGALASKNFEAMMEEDIAPPSPPVGKRVLDDALDPRSPTCGIVRTPIQVLKTPEFVHDPRSPTPGIDRTPICTKFGTTGMAEDSPGKAVEVEMNTVAPLNMSELLEEMDQLQGESEPTSLPEDLSQTAVIAASSANVLGKNLEKRIRKPKTTKIIGHTNAEAEGLDSGKQSGRSPLKVLGDRSPLTSRNVDYNSPRAIVQRKQASKIAIKKPALQISGTRNSPVKYRTMTEDKENM